jgi:hypothetical protein
MKKTLFVLTVLFSVMVCATANAGAKSPIYLFLAGILRPHAPLPPQPPPLPYVPFVPLNDTGITWGGNYPIGNNAGCTGEEIGAQDCSHGRDTTHNDDTNGHAGFSFTKLDANGVPLANQTAAYTTTPWACVQDNVTGLIWEVKTNDGGLHDQHENFTWYNTNPGTNGGNNGDDNADAMALDGTGTVAKICEGYVSGDAATYCNTQAYVARVNAVGWCGKSDWRMPTVKELEGIALLPAVLTWNSSFPAIDTGYFPNTPAVDFWSGTPSAWSTSFAWTVGFRSSFSRYSGRDYVAQVRLVRGGQ